MDENTGSPQMRITQETINHLRRIRKHYSLGRIDRPCSHEPMEPGIWSSLRDGQRRKGLPTVHEGLSDK
jgi:hypothetical protein